MGMRSKASGLRTSAAKLAYRIAVVVVVYYVLLHRLIIAGASGTRGWCVGRAVVGG